MATFGKVLKVARDDGLTDVIPSTPRVRQKNNPRAFVRFAPLVPDGTSYIVDEMYIAVDQSPTIRISAFHRPSLKDTTRATLRDTT
jgi:hypothetical protein